jgi:hypothetical protein
MEPGLNLSLWLGVIGLILTIRATYEMWQKRRAALSEARQRIDEFAQTTDPDSGYSYEWLAFNRPNKPSEDELQARALEVYGPLQTVMSPMSAEYTAWFKKLEDEERAFASAEYTAFLNVFECDCDQCTPVFQWGHYAPVRWAGPCADKQWDAWKRQYAAVTAETNAKLGYYNKRGRRLA